MQAVALQAMCCVATSSTDKERCMIPSPRTPPRVLLDVNAWSGRCYLTPPTEDRPRLAVGGVSGLQAPADQTRTTATARPDVIGAGQSRSAVGTLAGRLPTARYLHISLAVGVSSTDETLGCLATEGLRTAALYARLDLLATGKRYVALGKRFGGVTRRAMPP
jgi:hypothetical protein